MAATPSVQRDDSETPPAVAEGRDLRIDLLRGFCVFAMVVDHIGGFSPLYALTGGNRFYTSAAEAFIFISGLVMGLAYRRLVARDGLGPALLRAMARAVTLYLVTITLTFVFLPLSEALALPWAQGVDFSDPVAFVVSVLTLHRTYYLVDIPLLYTLVIFLAPLAIAMLSQGRSKVVLALAWLWWGAYQFFPEYADAPWPIAGNYLFYLSAWQVFFVTGLVLGWHHSTLARRLAHFPQRAALFVTGLGFVVLIVLDRITSQLSVLWPDDPERALETQLFLVEMVFGKGDVRPGRIVASIVIFGFFYLLVTVLWQPVRRCLGWLLLPLGESALYAYAAHVILAIPVTMLVQLLHEIIDPSWLLHAAAQLGILLLIRQLIAWRVLFVNPNRGWSRYALPASATAACLLLLPLDPSPRYPGIASAATITDPYASRVARAFGTPVPGTPPRGEGTPIPLPRPSLRQALGGPQAAPPVNPYVGRIQGSLLSVQFFSPALQIEMPYFIYLPPGYRSEGRLYPVLFLLHGNSGSYEEWLAYGFVDGVDRMIVRKEISPVVVVFPQGDFSYWVNSPWEEGLRWGDYLSVDLVRHIGATYRVFADPERRAVGGLSMGGTGALVNAFWRPDVFGAVGAHSPSLPPEGTRDFLGLDRDYQQRDPISIANMRPQRVSRLNIWIDVGEQDSWLARTEELHDTLDAKGIAHEWRVFPGDHDGEYWASHVIDYLRYYDSVLNPLGALAE
ncbi:MAG: OpgC domain-containing protein [Chloroflexi bacterium]|nr:OpgC domain-containing protein [Chloroflexota bacterium]